MTTNRKHLWKVLLPVFSIVVLVVATLFLLKSQKHESNHLNFDTDDHIEMRVGATLPDFTLLDLEGNARPVSKSKAKVMLINFWATWCEACLVEMPSIIALHQDYRERGFGVLAVSVDEDPETVVPASAKRFGMNFPLYIDPNGELAELFNVNAIPFTVIIDQNRKILLIETGERNWNAPDVRSLMDQWLK